MKYSTIKKYILLIILLFVIILPLTGFAQTDFRFYKLSSEDGLSNDDVRGIIQDDNGFLWIATGDGVNRYDGYDFKTYKYRPESSNSLSDNSTQSIFIDSKGIIWISTYAGLTEYNPETGEFKRYYTEDGLSYNYIKCVYEDSEGLIWIGTGGEGLNILNRNDNSITVLKNDPEDPKSLPHNYIYRILEDQDGYMWIATRDNGIARLDKDTYEFAIYEHDPKDPKSISNNEIASLYEDKNGTIWVGTLSSGLNRYNKSTNDFTAFTFSETNPQSISDNDIYSIYEDSNNRFWVGTGKGLNLMDRNKGTFQVFKHNPADVFSIGGDRINTIYEDSSGNLWFGTKKDGLSKLPVLKNFVNFPINKEFILLSFVEDSKGNIWVGGFDQTGLNKYNQNTGQLKIYKQKDGLSDNSITSVMQDSNSYIWVGTENGLNRLNPDTNKITVFKNNQNDTNSIADNHINHIVEDGTGNIWIGTNDGLDMYNPDTGEFTHYNTNTGKGLRYNHVDRLYVDSTGMLWLSNNIEGFHSYSRKHDSFKYYNFITENTSNTKLRRDFFEDSYGILWLFTRAKTFRYNRATDSFSIPKLSHPKITWDIYEDSRGDLWFSTEDGLDYYNRIQDKFTHYRNEENNPQSLSYNAVLNVIEDSEGHIWVGTYGGGLNKFDRENETFTYYTEGNGLSSNIIYGMVEDNNKNLWVSTKKGISKLNMLTNEIRTYDQHDGLADNEFVQWEYYKTKQDNIFFTNIKGVTIFDPENIKDNPNKPDVLLTSFKIFGKDRTFDVPITEINEVNLNHDENFFSFEFASMDFTRPDKNQYRYKLEGLDKEWTEAGTRHYVSYTDLDEGMYIFKFNGSNNDKIWNDEISEVSIHIEPKPLSNIKEFSINDLSKAGDINIPYTENSFRLEFSPLDYSLIENNPKYILEGIDKSWQDAGSKRHVVYNNLNSGKKYIFKAKNDVSGEYINKAIYIHPPFWATWWFTAIWITLIAAAVVSIYIIRMTVMRRTQKRLEDMVDKRTAELNEANHILKLQNDQMLEELKMAERVQRSIIPDANDFPQRTELSFGSNYSSMENIGGDLYDVIRIGRNSYGFLIADVSGHGIPAALITTMVKVSFNSHSSWNVPTGQVCTNVNEELFKFIGDLDYYLTAYYAMIDLESGVFKYTNCGHHPALLLRKKDDSIEELDTAGFFIGAFEDINYETGSTHLEEGDRILLFTDGIIEARDKAGDFYEYERLYDFINKNKHLSPVEFVDKMIEDVKIFCDGHPADDDRAILYIEFISKIDPESDKDDGINIEVRKIDKDDVEDRNEEYNEDIVKNMYGKAIQLIKDKQYEEALEILNELKKRHPENPKILHSIGIALFKLDRCEEAKKVLEDAVNRDAKNEILKRNLAVVNSKLESDKES